MAAARGPKPDKETLVKIHLYNVCIAAVTLLSAAEAAGATRKFC